MNKGMSRSIKTSQIKMRKLHIVLDGTAATPVVSGFDAGQIKEVIDNGVGSYTIVLKRPFNKENKHKAMAMVTAISQSVVPACTAVDFDRVTIDVEDTSGGAIDAQLMIEIIGCDHRFNY